MNSVSAAPSQLIWRSSVVPVFVSTDGENDPHMVISTWGGGADGADTPRPKYMAVTFISKRPTNAITDMGFRFAAV